MLGNICRFCLPLFLTLAVAPGGAAGGDVDFLVPGVSFASVVLRSGTSVEYLIVAHAYGTADSSLVELAVLEGDSLEALLEVSSSPYPPSADETVTVRLRLDRRVTTVTSPIEFYDYVKQIQVRSGTEPFREPSSEELDDFKLEEVFLSRREGMTMVRLEPGEVETPAGRFDCEASELSRHSIRTVNLGGVAAERVEKERSVIWMSPDIPFWGLVRSTVERTRMTKIPGYPESGKPKKTVTESILVAYDN